LRLRLCPQLSYGLGILIRTYSMNELIDSAPWLLGSLGVVSLDVLISLQVKAPDFAGTHLVPSS